MAIRRFMRAKATEEADTPRGFDAYDLRLGDLMRGERATLGKSLLDVEREIRIKASYIAAIENADPDAFDTPGFIPGYVRSYARYLRMDPDEAFEKFCRECNFSLAHGMSAGASSTRKPETKAARQRARNSDPIIASATPFAPESEGWFSRVEPGALGSVAVLVALISAIGYGGWSVLTEIQRVQFAPVENTPDVLTDLDPISDAMMAQTAPEDPVALPGSGLAAPAVTARTDRLERMYRPEALDVPVMVARDAPIAALNPDEVGTLRSEPPAPAQSTIDSVIAEVVGNPDDAQATTPQVLEQAPPGVRLVAVRPAWVRVSGPNGSILFEGILNGGDTYDVPATEEPPVLRVGESGAVYFEMDGNHYGPVGPRGSVTRSLALAPEALTEQYEVADITADDDLERYVAELETAPQD
jgi:cytoskeletal protein RodZ